jgi:signal transduction histidine kinase
MFKIEDAVGDVVFITFKDVERISTLGIKSPSGHYLVKGLDHVGIWLEHPGVILAKTVDRDGRPIPDEKIVKVAKVRKENKGQVNELEKKRAEIKASIFNLNKSLDEDSALAAQLHNARTKLLTTREDLSKVSARSAGIKERSLANVAVNNIIRNAIVYSEKESEVRISITQDQSNYILSIEDDGFGIKEKELPFIFERFYRSDKARSRKDGGTGLGLSIVKMILDLHHYDICIKSEVNKGTTVVIKMPVEK